MTEIVSLPGLIGAAAGLLLGLLNYGVVVGFVEKRLRAMETSTGAERAAFERRIVLMRRVVLVTDIVAFSAIGYWFGRTLGG